MAIVLPQRNFYGLDQCVAKYLERYGGEAVLAQPKSPLGPKLSTGTKLVRDWHGVGHSVTVLDNGFDYDGQHWKSLTAIARHITGTKWSGPRFFGLTVKGPAS